MKVELQAADSVQLWALLSGLTKVGNLVEKKVDRKEMEKAAWTIEMVLLIVVVEWVR